MVLKLTVDLYIRNVISFSYKSKTRRNSNIYNIFSEIFNFSLGIHKKSTILSLAIIMTSLWCHTRDVGTYIGQILVCMERKDIYLYYGANYII